jgi:hypothetical protein
MTDNANYPEPNAEPLVDLLYRHHASPRLNLWEWRLVLTAIARSGDLQLFRRLTAALAEDDASEGVPVTAFARLLEISGHAG